MLLILTRSRHVPLTPSSFLDRIQPFVGIAGSTTKIDAKATDTQGLPSTGLPGWNVEPRSCILTTYPEGKQAKAKPKPKPKAKAKAKVKAKAKAKPTLML